MKIKGYLAQTPTEFFHSAANVGQPAWMSCHFSAYGKGLSNLPRQLPAGSMVILDDSTPPDGHNPTQILDELTQLWQQWQPDCILLDFQRPGSKETAELAQQLTQSLPYPVGVSELYGYNLSCPLLLDTPPADVGLSQWAARYPNRELWLELSTQATALHITQAGCACHPSSLTPLPNPVFFDAETACRYHWYLENDTAVFLLQRDTACLQVLYEQADALGITRAVGLLQQLGSAFF